MRDPKALSPIVMRLAPRVSRSIPFPKNALSPIAVTLSGITTSANWFPLNAPVPITFIPSGIVILLREFCWNALSPIFVTIKPLIVSGRKSSVGHSPRHPVTVATPSIAS